jgi:hypothetical protein
MGAHPLAVHANVVSAWIGDLHERPNPRSFALAHIDSAAWLANATDSAGRGNGAIVL